MRKLTLFIFGVGMFTLIVSWIRWFFMYQDNSQLVLGTGIAACFIGFAYIHWWVSSVQEDMKKVSKRMDDVTRWFVKEEIE